MAITPQLFLDLSSSNLCFGNLVTAANDLYKAYTVLCDVIGNREGVTFHSHRAYMRFGFEFYLQKVPDDAYRLFDVRLKRIKE